LYTHVYVHIHGIICTRICIVLHLDTDTCVYTNICMEIYIYIYHM